MKNIISQLNYPHVLFPGTPHPWSLYGCLASTLCMLLDKSVEEFVAENPTGWESNGNLKTDAVLAKYGYRIVKETVQEGQPLKVYPHAVIHRTTWFAPKFPTHFYIQMPNTSDIVDPASRNNPKQVNRYAGKVNEVRFLEKVQSMQKCPTCGK